MVRPGFTPAQKARLVPLRCFGCYMLLVVINIVVNGIPGAVCCAATLKGHLQVGFSRKNLVLAL